MKNKAEKIKIALIKLSNNSHFCDSNIRNKFGICLFCARDCDGPLDDKWCKLCNKIRNKYNLSDEDIRENDI